jgi:putative phosphoesterase
MKRALRLGLISDTHGLLRPEALQALEGSDAIIHGGDIGDPAILDALEKIAPVTAVRGNNDREPWAKMIRDTEVLEIGDAIIYVIHDVNDLDVDPAAAGFGAVVSGHSHRPGFHMKDGVLFVNPGSAGPRRFSLPISVARLDVSRASLVPTILELKVSPRAAQRR